MSDQKAIDAAANQILTTFEKRIAKLQSELDRGEGGWVFCWDKYSLGATVIDGKPRNVGIEDAMIVGPKDRRFFQNGANEYAVLMPRKKALRAALKSVTTSRDFIINAINQQKEQA